MSDNVFVNDKLTMASTQSDKSLKRLEVFLRPTEKNEFFRFRLLWFRHDGSNRRVPYIERWIHQVWEDGDDGKKKLNEVICPISRHVAENWPGNPYDDCPICQFAGLNFITFKDSAWTDKVAGQNYKNFKRKYDLVVPVYIVSDPCYSGNVGKIRVFRISDSKVGEKFKKLIVEKSAESQIFNGGKAVDFLIRMDKVEYTNDNGSVWTKNEIVQMGFTKKPYELNAITPELVNAFPFDDYFGASPTLQDLKYWHKEHCLHATKDDDIDFDGLSDMTVDSTPQTQKPMSQAKTPQTAPKPESDDEVPEMTSDFDEEGLDAFDDVSKDIENPLEDIPDILKGDEDDEIPEIKSVSGKNQPAVKKSNTSSDIDVDDLLASVNFD